MLLRCKEKANKGWENKTSNSNGNYFVVLRFGHACVLNIMAIGHYTINIFQVLMIFWVDSKIIENSLFEVLMVIFS